MSISVRVFFFNSDNSIIKIPLSRYDRLFNNDPDESFPEYIGKRIKCAIACVELENRSPLGLKRSIIKKTVLFLLTAKNQYSFPR